MTASLDTRPLSPKRILLCCYSVPGRGGANTSGYELFRRMQGDGYNVAYMNLVDEKYEDYYKARFGECMGNPGRLADVHNVRLHRPLNGPHPEVALAINRLEPDIILAISCMGTYITETALPGRRVLFLTSGSSQAREYIETGKFKDAMALMRRLERGGKPLPIRHNREAASVASAHRIFTHSKMIHDFYHHFFPAEAHKIHDTIFWRGEWIYERARRYAAMSRPFDERDIDVLFVASSWSRKIKNFDLVRRLTARLKNRSVHLVGECRQPPKGAVHHGLTRTPEQLFELFGRARTVVCPSLLDAAPGVLFEASAMGCNIVASRNCGNWMICHPDLLAEEANPSTFARKIELSLAQKMDDAVNYFLEGNLYQRFVKAVLES